MKLHLVKGSKSASSRWVRTFLAEPQLKGRWGGRRSLAPSGGSPDPTATSTQLARLPRGAGLKAPRTPPPPRDFQARDFSTLPGDRGTVATLRPARDSEQLPRAPREQGGQRGARRVGGGAEARAQPGAAPREGAGGPGAQRARPGRKEAGSRHGRVLSLSPPRDPEPPSNSARRPRAPASVPGIACGRAGWCGRRGARRGEGLWRGGARKLGRGGAGSGRLDPQLPGAGTRWVFSGAAGVTASGSPSLPGIP